MAVISVTQLNRYVGFKLKEDRMLQGLLVQGEITNFTNHYRSGHFYFTIRDEESSVKGCDVPEQGPASALYAGGRHARHCGSFGQSL